MKLLKLYIDHEVADSSEVKDIKSRLDLPCETVWNAHEFFESISSADDPVQKGKQALFLTKNKGAFIRPCPGTSYYTCCGYIILHIGTFCIMDCSYCILQSYFHPPVLQYFVNHDDMKAELHEMFQKKIVRRVGTGEFTDSMIWEKWTNLSEVLVPEFADQSFAMLELKTKTTAVKALKKLKHNRKTVVSWSLNTNTVINNDERHTTSLSARLKAAAECESLGYPLAFHFDPMIIYEGCEEDYRQVVNKLFSAVSAGNILWISLGALRFMPALKPVIQKRFPLSKIVYGEFISGLDGKMRYFKPLRINLYKKMASWIREAAPDVLIYFCMEDDEVWERSLGFNPSDRGGLPLMLDRSAIYHCGLEK